jgi:hypothetical protein
MLYLSRRAKKKEEEGHLVKRSVLTCGFRHLTHVFRSFDGEKGKFSGVTSLNNN